MSRHNLLSWHKHLLRLEQAVSLKKIELKPEQLRLLEPFSPEFRERHIETKGVGELVTVDTLLAGYLLRSGPWMYLQSVIDCHRRDA